MEESEKQASVSQSRLTAGLGGIVYYVDQSEWRFSFDSPCAITKFSSWVTHKWYCVAQNESGVIVKHRMWRFIGIRFDRWILMPNDKVRGLPLTE